MKDVAYVRRNGNVQEVSMAEYKTWMTAHDYDPEHGRETPMRNAPSATAQQPATAPQQ